MPGTTLSWIPEHWILVGSWSTLAAATVSASARHRQPTAAALQLLPSQNTHVWISPSHCGLASMRLHAWRGGCAHVASGARILAIPITPPLISLESVVLHSLCTLHCGRKLYLFSIGLDAHLPPHFHVAASHPRPACSGRHAPISLLNKRKLEFCCACLAACRCQVALRRGTVDGGLFLA